LFEVLQALLYWVLQQWCYFMDFCPYFYIYFYLP